MSGGRDQAFPPRPSLVTTHRPEPALLPRPRLLACDLDGTLLDPSGIVRPSVRQAMRTVIASGVAVVLATGRSPWDGLPEIMAALGLDGPQITMQGALVTDPVTGSTLRRRSLPQAVARDGLIFAARQGLEPVPSYAPDDAASGVGAVGPRPRGGHTDDIIRLYLPTPPERHWNVRRALAEEFLGRATITWSDEHGMDLLPLGTSKGEALAAYAMRLGIPLDAVAAIGDAHNDIEMLRVAGRSAAMGTATPAVRAAADIVTGSARGDGIIDALRWLFPDLEDRLAPATMFAGLRLLS